MGGETEELKRPDEVCGMRSTWRVLSRRTSTLACLGITTALAACSPPGADVAVLVGDRDCRPDDDCRHDFGIVRDEGASQRFDVVNYGDRDATITSITLESGVAGDFVVGGPSATHVSSDAHVSFVVTARKPAGIPREAMIAISWGEPASVTRIRLTASAPPGPELDADCDFGSVPMGTTSEPCLIRLINRDAEELDVTDLGLGSPVFAPVGPVPLGRIPGGSEWTVEIVATPTELGVHHGVFSVGIDDDVMLMGALTVTGI